MDPFLNNDLTTSKNVTTYGEYSNPTEVNKANYVYTTTKEIPIEVYFNQPNLENNTNSYNITYLPGINEVYNNEYNNYSYPFSDKINSEKNNNNNDYYNQLLSNEYISNTNYNNYGNIENTSELNNISNYATVKPISKKNENINYVYYDNNSELLNPSTNVNYYTNNSAGFYTGLNTTNLESIPYLVSDTTNNINNINLNENYSYDLNNNISNTNYNYNYVLNTTGSSHASYNNNVSKNIISKNNIILNNNNIYSVNAFPIKYKERSYENAIEENSKGFNKISSKYLMNIIFNYIKDDLFKYKLFMHSKKFRKISDLSPIDYQEKSISRTGIKVCNYLSGYQDRNYGPHTYFNSIIKNNGNEYYRFFERETLKKDFLLHLEKLKIKYIKNYLVYYFKKYKENKKDDSNLYIDIFCPFFDFLSNQEYFGELFTIPIVMPFIKKNLMENEYISVFDKLNKSQKYLSILFKYSEEKDIDFFKKCINLNKVRKLIIYEDKTNEEKDFLKIQRLPSQISKMKPPKMKKMADLFSLITSANLLIKLLYLKLNLTSFNKKEFNIFENLNLFKSLNYLELENFRFFGNDAAVFELKLDSLRVLKLLDCNIITISNNCCFHLKELYIIKSKIENRNSSLLKFPNLEKCKFYFYLDDQNIQKEANYIEIGETRFNSKFDFSSMNNLKVLNCEANDFLMLKNASLESLTVESNDTDNSKEKEKRVIEKIISMKSLKELVLSVKLLDDNDISGIRGVNTSVEKFTIHWHKSDQDCTVINLQKKFPNVNNFSLITENDSHSTNIQIEEKVDCKINKLILYGGKFNIRLYCLPFENLVEFDLIIFINEFNGIKETLPFFSNHCHLIFKSLISFKFRSFRIKFELLNNLCDNLEKMPNLKTLVLKCNIEVDKSFYDKLNKKISLLKLNDIDIKIKPLSPYKYDYYKNIKLINSFNESEIIIKK